MLEAGIDGLHQRKGSNGSIPGKKGNGRVQVVDEGCCTGMGMGVCMKRSKVEASINGPTPCYVEEAITNGGRSLVTSGVNGSVQVATPIVSSQTTCNGDRKRSHVKVVEELKAASHLRRFTFNDLKCATRNFRPESLLGEGGFGCVFKGWIEEKGTAPVKPGTGLTVAVKILNQDGLQGHEEWLAEVNFLGDLIHPNLVTLIGYCIEDDQRLLVYEFMPRGSLENHLFRRVLPLPWSTRLKIALCAAKGLAFLHEEVKRPVIYRDFKTSNILLDLDYNAKLSDFGLAKELPEGDKSHISTRVLGTYGYAAPEYVMTGHLSTKSDVYSFGVVLLEVVTGRRSMDKNRTNGEHNLVEWARPRIMSETRGGVYTIIDPRLEGNFSIRAAQKAAHIAGQCLSRDPRSRPCMSDVVESLKPLLELTTDIAGSSPSFRHFIREQQNSNSSDVNSNTSKIPNGSKPHGSFKKNASQKIAAVSGSLSNSNVVSPASSFRCSFRECEEARGAEINQ